MPLQVNQQDILGATPGGFLAEIQVAFGGAEATQERRQCPRPERAAGIPFKAL